MSKSLYKRKPQEWVIHSSGYKYIASDKEEFLEVMNAFASSLLRAHRNNSKIVRPPFIKQPHWTHMLACRLYNDYMSGAVEWHFEIHEDSLDLIKPPVASQASLQRLVAKEV